MKILTDKMEDLLYEYMEIYQDDKTPENGERLCTVLDAVLSLAEEPEDKQNKQDKHDKQKPLGAWKQVCATETEAKALCELMKSCGVYCWVEKYKSEYCVVGYKKERTE